MIDLTLDSMLVPALEGYKPVVGKKIEYTALNKGGLNTQQVVENIALPFVKQRSVIIDKSETSSVIEYDARIMISGEDVTFTLDRGVSPGIEIQVMCLQSASIRYLGIYQNTVTDHLNAFTIAKYVWTGSAWFCSSAPGIGSVKEQFPGTPEPYRIYGGQWEQLKLAGMFLRASGGDARPFTNPMKVSVSGTSVIVDSLDTNSNSSLSTLAVGDLLIGGEEYRTVTAITGNTITIDKEFTHSDMTTVLIGQNDSLQEHTHATDQVLTLKPGYGLSSGSLWQYSINQSSGTKGVATGRKSNETRSKNISIKYWKRTA